MAASLSSTVLRGSLPKSNSTGKRNGRLRSMPIRALASVDFGDAQLEAPAARSDEATPSMKPGLARLLTPGDAQLEAPAARSDEATPSMKPGLARLLTPRNMSLVNGRLAMMGLSAGVVGELLHGQPLGAQLLAAAPQALAASLLLAAATAAPLLRGVEEGDEIFGPFVPASERLNGNLAIVGLLLMVAIEALKGSALL